MEKRTKRLLAALAAAAVISGVFAGAVSAKSADVKTDSSDLPTPINASAQDRDLRVFKRAKPVVRAVVNEGWRYYTSSQSLEWDAVDNALYYNIYIKEPSDRNFRFLDRTLDTSFEIENRNAQYKVRPMTFSYDDKEISGALSDAVTVRKQKEVVYEYEDDGMYATEEVAYNGGAVYTQSTAYSYTAPAYAPAPKSAVYPGYNTEEYTHYDESGYKSASQSPLSTFSADVDTASYSNVRRMVKGGYDIPSDAVRIEEFINYFDYSYPAPDKDNTLSVSTMLSDCPWNSGAKLLRIGVQAKELEKEPASNLVFLIDVSGSMYSQDKLPLVVESLNELTGNLSADDTLSIVVYSGEERIILAGARGNQRNTVKTLTSMLEASGSTNGEQGINMAYDIARRYFKKGANNRVIMATDGDLNVGISDKDELEKFIAKKAESGVYFTILGFGTENIKDNKMEALAKEGNGNYYYIDCFEEAQKVLTKEKNGTLLTVADDVKFQVEFNPNTVSKYRLIGYDGRTLANEDFRNDDAVAAEMGAGQSVTVLYEIIPADGKGSSLKYQKATASDDLCTVSVRYKDGENVREISREVDSSRYVPADRAGRSFTAAAAAAEFAISLRGSEYAKNADARHALTMLEKNGLDKKNSSVGYSEDLAEVIRTYLQGAEHPDEEPISE